MTAYFDTAYLAKCYLNEPGHQEVSVFASSVEQIFLSDFSRLELTGVFHRKLREGFLTRVGFRHAVEQFRRDCSLGVWTLLPCGSDCLEASTRAFERLEAGVFLRAPDCIHLTTAREAGFSEVYSNDRHLLAAAPAFGLRGVNILAGP